MIGFLPDLSEEAVLTGREKADHLALGNGHAERAQLRDQARPADLTPEVLGEHEAAQARPEMAAQALRQRRDHVGTVRGAPALAAERAT